MGDCIVDAIVAIPVFGGGLHWVSVTIDVDRRASWNQINSAILFAAQDISGSGYPADRDMGDVDPWTWEVESIYCP